MKSGRLVSIAVGQAAALRVEDQTVMSGICKTPVSTLDDPRPVEVRPLGLAGDEQVDLTVHGGRDKAVYMYPAAHYAFWHTVRAQALQREDALPFGFLGENLTVEGIDEQSIWIGDELRIGDASFWVSGPRSPCYKFNTRMGFKHAAKMMWQSGYTGWYLMVKQEAPIRAGDAVALHAGPRELSLAQQHDFTRRKAIARQLL